VVIVGGPTHGQERLEPGSVTVGHDYTVLSVLAPPNSPIDPSFQIIGDYGDPEWWPSVMFTTTSTRIPTNWRAVVDGEGVLHIAPAAWLERGFWEAWYDEYYGHRPRGKALETYERELEVILREA
jgi:hypothetical protein